MKHDFDLVSAISLDKVVAVDTFMPNSTYISAATRKHLSIAVGAKEAKIRRAVVLAVSVDVVEREHYGLPAPLGLWRMQFAGFDVALIWRVLLLAPHSIRTPNSGPAWRREAVFKDLADAQTGSIHVRPNAKAQPPTARAAG